jgi:hypothetical protein
MMATEPAQLAGAPRCGAKTRGARGGRPCKSPAMPNGRCRMHGGKSGAPSGERNGAYKTGRHTKEAKAVRAWAREMAREAEVFLAVTMDKVGRKPPAAYRRRRHVKRALAELKAKAKAKDGAE